MEKWTSWWRTIFDSGFYLRQSTDAGDVIWSVSLCVAADPGHLFRRSSTGQCIKSSVHIYSRYLGDSLQVSCIRHFVKVGIWHCRSRTHSNPFIHFHSSLSGHSGCRWRVSVKGYQQVVQQHMFKSCILFWPGPDPHCIWMTHSVPESCFQ